MNGANYYGMGLGPHEQIISNTPRPKVRRAEFHFSSLILMIALGTFFVNGVFFYLVLAHTHSNDSIDRTGTNYLVASN